MYRSQSKPKASYSLVYRKILTTALQSANYFITNSLRNTLRKMIKKWEFEHIFSHIFLLIQDGNEHAHKANPPIPKFLA